MNPILLAKALAERLAEVVPKGIHVAAAGATVEVSSDRIAPTSIWTDLHRPDDELHFRDAADSVLNAVQDFVSEELHVPWPHLAGKSHEMAMPVVRIKDGTLF